MTTKNPRLTITLKPSLSAQLRELSRLTGNSQSSLIAELLDGSQVVFDRMIKVLQAAESAKQSLKGKLADDMGASQTRIEQQLGLVLEDFDQAAQPFLDQMEDIQRRSGRASTGAAVAPGDARREATPTPLSNRGVRSTANPKKSSTTRTNKPSRKGVTSDQV